MHKVRTERVHRADVESAKQCELLQEDRALTPWPAFQNGMAVIVIRGRVFDSRRPAGEIVRRQQAAMAPAGDIQHLGGPKEPVDRLSDEAAVPGGTGGIDTRLARGADGLAADA